MSFVNRQEKKLCLQKECLQKKQSCYLQNDSQVCPSREQSRKKNSLKIKDDLYDEKVKTYELLTMSIRCWPIPGEKLTILLK